MKLSEEEKDIILKICNKEVQCFRDFLLLCCSLTKVENNGQIIFENGGVLSEGHDVLLVKSINNLVSKQHLFISLCNRLQSLGFIDKVYSALINKPSLLTYSETTKYNSANECENIYHKNGDFHITPTHELLEFINNNFMTNDEIEQQIRKSELKSEQNARKRSELITVFIAILSMIVSIALSYFNYMTYSNERKVYIENMSNLQSPIKVEIINKDNPTTKK
nr:hypothetical protein [uncultured Tolumonas sp.]